MASDLVRNLHAREGSRLLRFFHACLRSPQDAADASQETYLRLLRVRDPEAIADPSAYLFKVARSVAIATGTRATADRTMFVADPAAAEAAPCEAPGVERILASRQELALLARAIDALPPRCREVFVLSRLGGLSNGAIAERLGISRNMVEKHIMRALMDCRNARREAERGGRTRKRRAGSRGSSHRTRRTPTAPPAPRGARAIRPMTRPLPSSRRSGARSGRFASAPAGDGRPRQALRCSSSRSASPSRRRR